MSERIKEITMFLMEQGVGITREVFRRKITRSIRTGTKGELS